jgi:hypothetical protein
MIADYVRLTGTMFEAVNTDYERAAAAGTIPPSVLQNWKRFYGSWKAFQRDEKSSWWGGSKDRAEDYRTQLKEWRATVANYVKPTSLEPHVEQGLLDKLTPSGGTAVMLGFIVIGGLVLYVLGRQNTPQIVRVAA